MQAIRTISSMSFLTMTAYGTARKYTLYTTGSVKVQTAASVVVRVVKGDIASKTVQSNIFEGDSSNDNNNAKRKLPFGVSPASE
jgi:hypothetical protein